MRNKVFMGSESMTIDQKGRVGIPSRFVDVLKVLAQESGRGGEELEVGVTVTTTRTLKIVPIGLFEQELEAWMKLDPEKKDEWELLQIASLSHDAVLDSQNRIKLNQRLLDLVKIGPKIVVSGHLKFMQIDNDDQWETKMHRGLDRYADVADKVARAREERARPRQFTIKATDEESDA
jgi:DNA-binding transcriptional regulator/RsmH inhibitor MraZ